MCANPDFTGRGKVGKGRVACEAGSFWGRFKVGMGESRAGVGSSLDRVDLSGKSAHQILSPIFQLNLPLSFHQINTSKIAGVDLRRPIDNQVAYQKVNEKSVFIILLTF